MAGEGLFFTGQVLKNNRDLLKEEATRKQLALQEEALNMRKQEAADRRRVRRESGIKSSSIDADYSGISDPRLKLEITNRASDFNKFVADSYDNQDPLIQSEIQDRKEDLKLFTEYAKGLDSKLSIYDPLNPDAANLRYQADSDGNNMIDVNKNNIFQELSDGTFDLASRISSFGNDFDGQVILNETTPGYKAILKGYEDNYMVGDDTYKGVPPGKKEEFIKSFTQNHLINSNTGAFSTTQAEKDYMTNEKFEIDGSVYDGIGAYLLEKEGFTDAPKKEERLRFDPNSEFFNEEDHVKYVDYLAEKVWSRDTSNPVLVRKGKPKVSKGEEGLSQKDIDFLSGPSKAKVSYGGVDLKFDGRMKDEVSDREIKVDIIPQSLLPGQGERQEQFNKLYTDAVKKGSKSVEAKVTRIGLTTDNQKVAVVKFANDEFLIPLESISSEIQELKKGSIGYKIAQLDVSAAPQGGGFDKTSWR